MVSLVEFLPEYHGSQLHLSNGARQQYLCAVRAFEAAMGRVTVSNLSEKLVVRWLSSYSDKVSPRTVNSKRQAILTLWDAAARDGLCRAPDRRQVPKAREYRRLPVAWTVTEIERLICVARTVRGELGPVPKRLWWPSMILAVWNTGARISAMLSARSVDCNLAERYLRLRAETDKSGCDRFFQLTDQTIAAVAGHYDPAREHVWPWPLCKRQLWHQFRRIVSAAGLTSEASMGLFHQLRRSSLSYTAANGGLDMARQHAGHASASTTLASYIDPRIVEQRTAADVLPPLKIDDDS